MQSETRQRTSRQAPGDTQRRCALTRVHRAKSDLIRFVLGPDGTVVPDLKERLPGRGAWFTAAHDTISDAVRHKAFGRALKANAHVPDGLVEQIDGLLTELALGAFGLANKAGELVFGRAKIEEALQKRRITALVHAADAAADGCRKLDGKALASSGGQGIPTNCAFTADQLGLASGRTNVIHAALIQGGAAQKFLAAASRVERYRQGITAFADRHGLDTE